MDEKTLQIILKARDEASDTLDKVGKNAGGVSDLLSKSFKNAAIVSSVALAGLVLEAKSAITAFAESEKVMAQTEAVIKSTGGAAGLTADEVEYMAGKMQRLSGVSDEAIMQGQNMLLTFTKIGKDVFPQASQTILDMSVAMGTDMKGAAIQLGKALQDPINGVSALRRVGVNFDESQQNTIKTLVESGKQMDAQKLILKELQVEFGGSAEAAGKTFTGQLNILKESFGNLQEGIGDFLANALSPMIPKFQAVVDAVAEISAGNASLSYLTETLAENFGKFGEAVGGTIEFLSEHKQLVEILAGALGGILLLSIGAATVAMATFIGVSAPVLAIAAGIGAVAVIIAQNWSTVEPILRPVFELIVAAFESISGKLEIFKQAWNGAWPQMSQVFSTTWTIIVGTFKTLWGALQVLFALGLATITGDWSKSWEIMKKGFIDIFNGLKTFASGWWDALVGIFGSGINKIIDKLNGFVGSINKVGGSMGVSIPSIPSFDTGGFVQNTGLAMVHSGEFVLSRDMLQGRQSIPQDVGGGVGQSINIEAIINTPFDLEALGYQLAWQMRNA